MTIIPEDTDYNERTRDLGARAEDSTRRIVAAIAGALEGFAEALDEYDVANESKRAMHEAGEITRSTATEAKAVAQTPEMRQVGDQLKRAGIATADATSSAYGTVRDGTVHAKDSVASKAVDMKDNVAHRVHDAREAAHERVESVKHTAQRARDEVRVRADAVKESGRRARVAPGRIRHELTAAFDAWKKGLVTAIAMFLAMAVFATIALIVLTIALVVGLNNLLGDPIGTFLVAGLYIVIAGIAFAVAKSRRARAADETQERMENAREEARRVGRPMKDAFSRGRSI